ncbi:hypothetical protein BGZ95_002878 [Linnemannia exigua]|uniref:Uncharacterized protein n=1 Tax=Linnemannia exigua TaxID=604196 RepID=A0AAD4DKG7_9FUNG|nr:hypothetical protein BGZ95_002878 [Linnemannia exigua]
MAALLETLTFNALQRRSILSTGGTNHEFSDHVLHVSAASTAPSPPQSMSSERTSRRGGLHWPTRPLAIFLDSVIALRIRREEVFLNQYTRKNGIRESFCRAMDGLKEQRSNDSVREPYLDTLPQEMVDSLSAPKTGDLALLEELSKFVEDNRLFKADMLALLNYLASDQCADTMTSLPVMKPD